MSAALFDCTPRLPPPSAKRAISAVFVVDNSTSVVAGRCAEVTARVRMLLDDRHLHRLDILALGVGDDDTGGEPTALSPSWVRWQVSHRFLEAPTDGDTSREEFVRRLGTECQRRLRVTSSSPIFRAAWRAVEAVNAHDRDLPATGAAVEHRLVLLSDGEETAQPAITAALRALGHHRRRGRDQLPSIKVKDDLAIEVCGLSSHVGGDPPLPPNAVADVWSAVFGRPILVEPTCPTDETLAGRTP